MFYRDFTHADCETAVHRLAVKLADRGCVIVYYHPAAADYDGESTTAHHYADLGYAEYFGDHPDLHC